MGAAAELFPSSNAALSVGEVTRRIKKILEDNIKFVWITGEISNCKQYPSGHLYFTLKDEEAQISCCMWKGMLQRIKFTPENGMQILAYGRIEVYAPRGNYQLIVESMEPRGAGTLAIQFEQLKEKLQLEGLFEAARKRPLPFYPRRIAIVTSPAGAALQDMLRTLKTRCPVTDVLIFPVKVQGEGAASEIAAAIAQLNLQFPDLDAIIVGRGGGSIEDLWAFNEEIVARAIHASRVPIISAVGHETDTTISDFVADVRALTPTDAANRVVPRLQDLEQLLADSHRKLRLALEARAELARSRLDGFRDSYALGQPLALLAQHVQRVDEYHQRLKVGLETSIGVRYRQRLDELSRSATSEVTHRIRQARERIVSLAGHLEAVSPVAVLARGYSITSTESGTVLRKASEAKPGQVLVTRLGEGNIRSKVDG